jgi:hypothetical protein
MLLAATPHQLGQPVLLDVAGATMNVVRTARQGLKIALLGEPAVAHGASLLRRSWAVFAVEKLFS